MADMDMKRNFEELYQSITHKKDNPSKQSLPNVSKHARSDSSGRYQTFKRNNVSSSSMMSESIIISSQRSAMSTFSLQSETIMIKSTKSEQRTTTVCQGENILSIKEELHQESRCEFSGSNRVITMSDESLCQDERESECSVSQYEATDGYQSGESRRSDVQHLCKDCKYLYKKVKKRKRPDIITDPRTTDPRPWYSKSWIFVNRTAARGSRKTVKRGLQSVLKRLRSLQNSRSSPTTINYRSCCRSHLFLKRNIRLREEEQKTLLFANQGEKKRKKTKSSCKSRRPKKAMSSNQIDERLPQIGTKAHTTYSFVLDSSQEEDADPEMKRYNLEIEYSGRKLLLKQAETHNSISGGLLHSLPRCSGYMTSNQDRVVPVRPVVTEPNGLDTRQPSVYPMQFGSFREQLENLKMGYIKSAIINEN